MEERWRWRGDGTHYLDASCLLYSADGRFQEYIDYA
jgi:hypothetical protein